MAYNATTWVDDDGSGTVGTAFTAAKMNNIEQGIERLTDVLARVATTTGLPSHTRSGNVLTASANGTLSVDGVTVQLGDYVLVKNEPSNTNEHGPYKVTAAGGASAAWVLTRIPEWDSSADALSGRKVRVSEGTTNADTEWLLLTNDTINLNTTGLVFKQVGDILIGTLANRPLASVQNRRMFYFATDTGQAFVSDATAWSEVSGHEAKTGLSYGTGWADFGAGALAGKYWKKDGMVWVQGGVKRTSGTGTTIATLPAGYRPADTVAVPCTVFGGTEGVTVSAAGVIGSSGSGAAAVATLLDAIHFPVDA